VQLTFAFYCVVTYLVVITVVGIYYGKKVKTQEDYSVAGRSLPTPILIGTLMATWMGAGTVLGGPAASGYQYGLMARPVCPFVRRQKDPQDERPDSS